MLILLNFKYLKSCYLSGEIAEENRAQVHFLKVNVLKLPLVFRSPEAAKLSPGAGSLKRIGSFLKRATLRNTKRIRGLFPISIANVPGGAVQGKEGCYNTLKLQLSSSPSLRRKRGANSILRIFVYCLGTRTD